MKYRYTLTVVGGPYNQQRFYVEADVWPPQSKLMGVDLAPYLPGTYELIFHAETDAHLNAIYRLREGTDYPRLLENMAKHAQCRNAGVSPNKTSGT